MADVFKDMIHTIEELEALRPQLGYPGKLAANKVIHNLEPHSKHFIQKSPFIIISTSNEFGSCDVSPRGDAPGFVHIVDDRHLFIPERPGNKRMDSIGNILANPQIGIIFIIPGLEETFRVNGKACISKDKELLEKTAVHGKLPLLGIGVEVEECFVHCAKALKRSGLWTPESWLPSDQLPAVSKMIASHVSTKINVTVEEVSNALEESYKNRMY
jgi:PPOX class probable FMN-dependent enzyme